MKWKSNALAAVVAAVAVACGSNSSDKETTTPVTTDINAPDTSALTIIDTTTTVTARVPVKTKTAFEKKYPQATNVKWENQVSDKEEDEQDHKVWFHWEGSDRQGRYDKNGDWVATTNEIANPSALPAAVTNAIKSQYGGYAIRFATREENKDGVAYEVILEKGNEKVKALIGEDGKVLKKKVM